MLKNLASSLILTERDAEYDDNAPKVKGRVTTTLQKAKEVRPLVEKCITIARRSLKHTYAAEEFETDADRGTEEWKSWRTGDQWSQWNAAIAPVVAARRRALKLLGDKEAVSILFDILGPRFEERDGGYTRILRLAETRLGDAGTKAILEFVGTHDRVAETSERPEFGDDDDDELEDDIVDEADDEDDDEDADDEADSDEEVKAEADEDSDEDESEDEEKKD